MSCRPRTPTGAFAACLALTALSFCPMDLCAAQAEPPINALALSKAGDRLPFALIPGAERSGAISFDTAAGRIAIEPGAASFFGASVPGGVGLIGRYRQALERETRRMSDRDSVQRWTSLVDDDEGPAPGVQREARKLVGGANGRILSQVVDRILESSSALQHARDYAEGVRLDVRRGGGVTMGSGRGADPAAEIAARFTLLLGSNPRVEMRTTLAGNLKTRVELSLANPGMRASLSLPISSHLSSSLAGGYEEGGADRWLSAGVGIKF